VGEWTPTLSQPIPARESLCEFWGVHIPRGPPPEIVGERHCVAQISVHVSMPPCKMPRGILTSAHFPVDAARHQTPALKSSAY
jgi:hypothetical protein